MILNLIYFKFFVYLFYLILGGRKLFLINIFIFFIVFSGFLLIITIFFR